MFKIQTVSKMSHMFQSYVGLLLVPSIRRVMYGIHGICTPCKAMYCSVMECNRNVMKCSVM